MGGIAGLVLLASSPELKLPAPTQCHLRNEPSSPVHNRHIRHSQVIGLLLGGAFTYPVYLAVVLLHEPAL